MDVLVIVILMALITAGLYYLFGQQRESRSLDKWSELDKERNKHFLLAIDARDTGNMAEFRWHYRIMERLDKQVKEAWDKVRLAG